jgi:hypothetical protein
MKETLEAPGGEADALGRSASNGPGASQDNTKDTTGNGKTRGDGN